MGIKSNFSSYLVEEIIPHENYMTYGGNEGTSGDVNRIIYGYCTPTVAFLTLVNNVFVCVVLLQPNMRSPTNMLLVALAISGALTGLCPTPYFLHYYTAEHYRHVESISTEWCYIHYFHALYLPMVFHTVSVWLTLSLAAQRYLYVCHPTQANRFCTNNSIVKVIVAVYGVAFILQLSYFLDKKHISYAEAFYPPQSDNYMPGPLIGCAYQIRPGIAPHAGVYYGIYFGFRALFIHLIPCVSLVVFNALLCRAMWQAQRKRTLLLRQNRQAESRRLAETNTTTLMLVIVVAIFILVEFPLAILHTATTLEVIIPTMKPMLSEQEFDIASVIANFLIILSYPVNFFIYCAMSHQFRQTFAELFVLRWWRSCRQKQEQQQQTSTTDVSP